MNKTALVLIGLVFSLYTYPQRYVYKKYLASNADVNIEIQKTKTGYVIYIPAYSVDPLFKSGGFRITNDQLNGFRQNLLQAQKKYIEWIETAKANNVKELYKKMEIKPNKIGGYFEYGDYLITDYSVYPEFIFQVQDSYGVMFYTLIINTRQLQYSKDASINCTGFIIESYKDINEKLAFFINILHPDSISNFLNHPKIEDSFK